MRASCLSRGSLSSAENAITTRVKILELWWCEITPIHHSYLATSRIRPDLVRQQVRHLFEAVRRKGLKPKR